VYGRKKGGHARTKKVSSDMKSCRQPRPSCEERTSLSLNGQEKERHKLNNREKGRGVLFKDENMLLVKRQNAKRKPGLAKGMWVGKKGGMGG